jgi:3-oxoacyl-[acyl-carrier-protein] synthase-3
MRACVLGLGQWLPETVRGNDAWPPNFAAAAAASAERELADAPALGGSDVYDAILARHLAPEMGDPFLGATRRRVADESVSACEAEARAAKAAIEDAGIRATDIDLVLSWAAVPDRLAPPNAPRVAHLVGATRALAFGVDAACATILGQLLFATSLVEAGRARHVLLTSSHLLVRAFRPLHPASPSIGDGAAAMVVGPSEHAGILTVHGVSQGEYYDAVTWRRAKGKDTPWYEAGGPMYLGTYNPEGARRLVRDTVRFGAETVTEAAARAGISLSDIDVLACVQPRRWVPFAIAEALGLSADIAPQTFDELAHLAGCGVVTNLIEARRRGMLAPRCDGQRRIVCMYAQGAGFTRAAAILRWTA